MKVYNANKTEELTEYDLEKGKLIEDLLTVTIPSVEGQSQEDYVINGSYTIVNPYIEALDEHTEEIPIYRYIPYTEQELAEITAKKESEERLNALLYEKAELQSWLKEHDYIGIKIATGRASIEEYLAEIEQMKQYANVINEIDTTLGGNA